MKLHRLFARAAFAAFAIALIAVGGGRVQAAPASSLLQAAPSVRALETPAAEAQPTTKAYYYYRYHRHYYHPYYRRHYYYRHYYYHPHYYYRPYYYHRYYYHPYYRRFWHPFYW